MYLLFENSRIALVADTSQFHESMAYDLNQGYSSAKVEKSEIPEDYEIFERNLYHIEVLHQRYRRK